MQFSLPNYGDINTEKKNEKEDNLFLKQPFDIRKKHLFFYAQAKSLGRLRLFISIMNNDYHVMPCCCSH